MGRRGIIRRPATIKITEPQTPLDRLWSINMFLVVVVVSVAVSILLVLSRPLVNHYRFEKAQCTVEEVRPRGRQNCSCGISCGGVMPCGQVFVRYRVDDPKSKHHGLTRRHQMLHEDELTLKRYPLCSIYTSAVSISGCDKNETKNQISVFTELKKYDDIAENSAGISLEEIENSTKPAELFRRRTWKVAVDPDRVLEEFECYYLPGSEIYGYAIRHHNPPLQQCVLLLSISWSIAGFDLLLQLAISFHMGMCKKAQTTQQPML